MSFRVLGIFPFILESFKYEYTVITFGKILSYHFHHHCIILNVTNIIIIIVLIVIVIILAIIIFIIAS